MINSVLRRLRRFIPAAARPFLAKNYRRWLARESKIRAAKRALLRTLPAESPYAAVLSQASVKIHPSDGMYTGDACHYLNVGLSAIKCIDDVLKSLPNPPDVMRVLDMPSGYGRELRMLVEYLPNAEFTACDIIKGGVDFCGAEFGCQTIYSSPDIENIVFSRPFDLIWCGSLITHLSEKQIRVLIGLFAKNLAPGGVMILTTAGDYSYNRMENDPEFYGVAREDIEILRASYAETGFGFSPYPDDDNAPREARMMEKNYGISLTSPTWFRKVVAETGGLREVRFQERGWDEHLDVYAYIAV